MTDTIDHNAAPLDFVQLLESSLQRARDRVDIQKGNIILAENEFLKAKADLERYEYDLLNIERFYEDYRTPGADAVAAADLADDEPSQSYADYKRASNARRDALEAREKAIIRGNLIINDDPRIVGVSPYETKNGGQ